MKPFVRHAPGFTLLEVLGALVLMALLLLGVYSGVRSATHTVQAGQLQIERLDQMRSAQLFLRRELSQALAQPIERNDQNAPIYFLGEDTSLRFVAPMPGYLGKLGPQLIEVKLENGKHGKQLVASLAILPPDGSAPKALGDPQILIDGIAHGSFRYRGFNPSGQPGDWENAWKTAGSMPNVVEIELSMERGTWPLLSVPLRGSGGALQNPANLLRGLRSPVLNQ